MTYRINPDIYKIVMDDIRKALSNKNLFTSELDTLLRDCELLNLANRCHSKQSSNSELIFMFDSSSSSEEEDKESTSSSSSEEEEDIQPSSHSTVWYIDSEDESSSELR